MSFSGSQAFPMAQARALAVELLARYGLSDWTFAFNRRKTAMGLCLYGPRRTELSVYFVQRNSAEAIEETLRQRDSRTLSQKARVALTGDISLAAILSLRRFGRIVVYDSGGSMLSA